MADEFYTGVCPNMSWWDTISSNTAFDDQAISCSTAIGDIGNFIDWTQPFLPYHRHEASIEPEESLTGFGDSSENPLKDMNQAFLPVPFEPDQLEDMNHSMHPSLAKFNPQFFRVSSSPKQQLNFCNNTSFWNPSASLTPAQLVEPRFEDEAKCSNQSRKSFPEGVGDYLTMKTSPVTKKNGSEPALKKPRIETLSPLPTFKVRKEKLGDRITALQQLVSPFGKTDIASVLHESIEYIKFLHDQVGVLSTPYLKDGHQMQQYHKNLERSKDGEEGPKQDLRSRGLCLVPISISTFAVASEIPVDFWTPTLGGSYR